MSEDKVRAAWEKWHTPRAFQNVQSGLDDMLSFEAGWQLCVSQIAQQPVAAVGVPDIERVAIAIMGGQEIWDFLAPHAKEGALQAALRAIVAAISILTKPQPDTSRDDKLALIEWINEGWGLDSETTAEEQLSDFESAQKKGA